MKATLLCRRQFVLLLATFISCACAVSGVAYEYELIDLGTLGGASSQAHDINNRGQIAGWAQTEPVQVTHREYDWRTRQWVEEEVFISRANAFLWDNGQMINLGLENETSHAYAINESTMVVGTVGSADNRKRAFRTQYGPLDEVPESEEFINNGIAYSIATDTNDLGQVVGNATVIEPGGGHRHTGYIHDNNGMRDLGNLLAAPSWIRAVNNDGMVVGEAWVNASRTGSIHAVIHDTNTGQTTDLGMLASSDNGQNGEGQPYSNHSHAYGINDAEQVVGQSYVDRRAGDLYPTQHAFLWEDGTMTDLGTLTDYAGHSEAADINEQGWIVGRADQRAFLYREGEMIDLNTLIEPIGEWSLHYATAVNDLGQIVGTRESLSYFHSSKVIELYGS